MKNEFRFYAFLASLFALSQVKGSTIPSEFEEKKLSNERIKFKVRQIDERTQGVKRWVIDGIEVYARNLKNAQRKVNNIKNQKNG